MLPLLNVLMMAPKIFETGVDIYNTVTGGNESFESETDLAQAIEELPPQHKELVTMKVFEAQVEYQRLDTQRFVTLTDGDAEKVKATARPEIALRCMTMMETPFRMLTLIVYVLVGLLAIEWLIEAVSMLLADDGVGVDVNSPLGLLTQATTAFSWEGVLAIIGPAYIAAVVTIKKYMGCRERDKAQEYEIKHGSPLNSANSTVMAASGVLDGLSSLAKLVKRNG